MARQLGGEVSSKGNVLCPGPGHSADDRSLSIKLIPSAPDGFILHSFANVQCRDYVRAKCNLPAFKPNGGHNKRDDIAKLLQTAIASQRQDEPKRQPVATFDYTDKDGTLLYQVLKFENPKTFRQRRPDGNGGWLWDLNGAQRVLYRAQELAKYPDACVFICEGEKDSDRVASLDHCATTVASGTWRDVDVEPLAGRDILVLEDNDEPGRKKAIVAANQLHGVAKTIRVVLLPDLPAGGDVSDWLDADPRRGEKLADVCFDVPLWTPDMSEVSEIGVDHSSEPAATAEEPESKFAPVIKSSREFIAGFVPPEYAVVGLLQRRFFYSLTGQTGAGKTAIMLLLCACAALGHPFAGRETKKLRVLYLAAENADDVRMRWIALAQSMGFDIDTIEVYFVEGRFTISKSLALLRAEAERHGGEFGLVVIDTGPTFFEGKEENENKQYGDHARLLRGLGDVVPGDPCIVANCHPVKNAGADQLIPRGGGAFLAEVDGNLTALKNDSAVELHWQGKFRGPDFAPMNFLIKTVTHQDLKDSDGRLIPTVLCEHISEQAREDIAAAARLDENAVLKFISMNAKATQAGVATAMGWKLHNGDPNKTKAGRCIKSLIKGKLIKESRSGRYVLTDEGNKALKGEAE
jgi:AAA domain